MLALLVLAAGPCLAAAPPAAGQAAETCYRLDNGLRLIVRENPAAATVVAVAAIAATQADEPAGRGGLRRLLQLCLVASAKTESAPGVDVSGLTQPDYISISARGVDRNWRAVINVLTSVLSTSIFGKETIVGEQRILQRLVAADREVASTVARQAGLATLYPAAMGELRPAAAYTGVRPGVLAEFRNRVVRPNRMTIVVSGPVKADEVRAMVKGWAGALVPGPDQQPRTVFGGRPYAGVLRVKMGGTDSAVWVGARAPTPEDPAYPEAVVGMVLLARGMGSRLFVRLRDDLGLTYGSTGQVMASDVWPSMYVLTSCDAAQASKVTAEVRAELGKLADEEAQEGELTRARRRAEMDLERLRMSNWQTAHYLSSMATMAPGMFTGGKCWELLQDLEAVGPGRLRSFFERWWQAPSVVQVLADAGQ